jgi:hypothetical protein
MLAAMVHRIGNLPGLADGRLQKSRLGRDWIGVSVPVATCAEAAHHLLEFRDSAGTAKAEAEGLRSAASAAEALIVPVPV